MSSPVVFSAEPVKARWPCENGLSEGQAKVLVFFLLSFEQ